MGMVMKQMQHPHWGCVCVRIVENSKLNLHFAVSY